MARTVKGRCIGMELAPARAIPSRILSSRSKDSERRAQSQRRELAPAGLCRAESCLRELAPAGLCRAESCLREAKITIAPPPATATTSFNQTTRQTATAPAVCPAQPPPASPDIPPQGIRHRRQEGSRSGTYVHGGREQGERAVPPFPRQRD